MRRVLALMIVGGFVLVACGDDDGGGDVAAFCDAVERVTNSDIFEGEDDPDAFQAAISDMREAMNDARANAPSEISDDVEVVVSQTEQFLDALSEIEDPADEAQVEAAFAVLDEEQGPTEELDAFILAECGIDPNETSE